MSSADFRREQNKNNKQIRMASDKKDKIKKQMQSLICIEKDLENFDPEQETRDDEEYYDKQRTAKSSRFRTPSHLSLESQSAFIASELKQSTIDVKCKVNLQKFFDRHQKAE